MPDVVIPYSATGISIAARFIFMYLLYTKKSVNSLSLTFCLMNMASSSLWLKYSLEATDMPLLVRSSADIALFTMSAAYIANNKWREYMNSIKEQKLSVTEMSERMVA
jgi:lipid-A-disaccharide synthase-like uncharacterized protein